MAFDLIHEVDVARDPEVKAPRVVHPRLPQAAGFVVLFGAERRVAQVLKQEQRLLVEGFPDRFWRFVIVP